MPFYVDFVYSCRFVYTTKKGLNSLSFNFVDYVDFVDSKYLPIQTPKKKK